MFCYYIYNKSSTYARTLLYKIFYLSYLSYLVISVFHILKFIAYILYLFSAFTKFTIHLVHFFYFIIHQNHLFTFTFSLFPNVTFDLLTFPPSDALFSCVPT